MALIQPTRAAEETESPSGWRVWRGQVAEHVGSVNNDIHGAIGVELDAHRDEVRAVPFRNLHGIDEGTGILHPDSRASGRGAAQIVVDADGQAITDAVLSSSRT